MVSFPLTRWEVIELVGEGIRAERRCIDLTLNHIIYYTLWYFKGFSGKIDFPHFRSPKLFVSSTCMLACSIIQGMADELWIQANNQHQPERTWAGHHSCRLGLAAASGRSCSPFPWWFGCHSKQQRRKRIWWMQDTFISWAYMNCTVIIHNIDRLTHSKQLIGSGFQHFGHFLQGNCASYQSEVKKAVLVQVHYYFTFLNYSFILL